MFLTVKYKYKIISNYGTYINRISLVLQNQYKSNISFIIQIEEKLMEHDNEFYKSRSLFSTK